MVGIAASGFCESIGMRCGASSAARRNVKNIFLRTACSGLQPSMMWTCMHINAFVWLCAVMRMYACLLGWDETGVSVRRTVITERTNTQSFGKISLHTYKLRCAEIKTTVPRQPWKRLGNERPDRTRTELDTASGLDSTSGKTRCPSVRRHDV